MKNCLITTPIYYVNGAPHIGHSYTNMVASCITEWKKLQSYKTFFLTGTDEHGQKVETTAKNANIPVENFANQNSKIFRDLANFLQIKYDDFIRTTEDRHKKAVQILWQILEKNGHIYLGSYEGWYSMRDEAFYDENELIDGKAPTGAEVKWHKEESYFFKLSAFQDKLLDFYYTHSDFILPANRFEEVINFVKSGLKDLSISRTSFKWGIPVPNNEKHVIYVWIDALTNYISALGFAGDSTQNDEKYKNFWENGEKIHVIGKDILRFHAVYWPAMLMAANLPLPDHLIAHGWWIKDGEKISKSLGNVIDPFELGEKFGIDYMRYFFLTECGLNTDGNYTEARFIEKINGDLVNNFGNLLSRTTNMVVQYLNGKITQKDGEIYEKFFENEVEFLKNFINLMDEYKFHAAANEIFKFSGTINQFIDQHKPWALFKSGELNLLNDVLYLSICGIKTILMCLKPFIPQKIDEIVKILNFDIDFEKIDQRDEKFLIKEKVNCFARI
jgi:methionyl-tRNA synthetase